MNDLEYENAEGLRRSDLWKINETPEKFKYYMEHKNDEEPSSSLIFGQAMHKFLLENKTFEDEFAVVPEGLNRRTKEGKAKYEELLQTGKTIISYADYEQIMAMTSVIMANQEARELLEGAHEVPFFGKDAATGISLKIKADVYNPEKGIIVDYKTTQSCSDGHFERSARMFGYDFQSAFYKEVIDAETLQDNDFYFIAQEKTEPYAVRIYHCDVSFVEQGQKKLRKLLQIYKYCSEKNEWKGYQTTDLLGEYYD